MQNDQERAKGQITNHHIKESKMMRSTVVIRMTNANFRNKKGVKKKDFLKHKAWIKKKDNFLSLM